MFHIRDKVVIKSNNKFRSKYNNRTGCVISHSSMGWWGILLDDDEDQCEIKFKSGDLIVSASESSESLKIASIEKPLSTALDAMDAPKRGVITCVEPLWKKVNSIIQKFDEQKLHRLRKILGELKQYSKENEIRELYVDDKGFTGLHWGCYYGHQNCVSAILESSKENNKTTIQVDQKTMDNGETALMLICKGLNDFDPSQNIINLLLQHGAKVDALDDDGNTCLHHAVINASKQNNFNIPVIRILKEHKCNLNVQNERKQKASDLVKSVDNDNKAQVIKLLEILDVQNPEGMLENISKNRKRTRSIPLDNKDMNGLRHKNLKIIIREDICKTNGIYKYNLLPTELRLNDVGKKDQLWSYGKEVLSSSSS